MAVTRIGAGAGGSSTGAAVTYNSPNVINRGMGTVAIVGVGISVSSNSTGTTCSVTYGGTAMTQLSLTLLGSGTERSAVGIYYLWSPPLGVQSIVVTPAGAATKAGVASNCVAYSGANGVMPSVQSAASRTLSATSVSDGFDFAVTINGAALSSPTQTSQYSFSQTVGGCGDSILIQDASGTGSNISFSSSGTDTTPTTLGVALTAASLSATLVDGFDTKDATRWTWQANATTGGSTAQITANTAFTGFYSNNPVAYNFVGSTLLARVTIANLTDRAFTMELLHDTTFGQNRWGAVIDGGTPARISLYRRVNNTGTNSAFTNYDTAAHAWIRLRDVDGATGALDASPDGLSWTQLATLAYSTLDMSGGRVRIASVQNTGTSVDVVDNLNLIPLRPVNVNMAVVRAANY